MLKGFLCMATVAGLATSALAQSASYGLRFEVSTDGSVWTQNLGVDVSSGSKDVFFRVSSFFTAGTQITTAEGTGNAVALARFTGTNTFTNFGNGFYGDLVTSYTRTLPNGNAAFLQQSQVAGNRILGQTGTPLSFASQLFTTLPPTTLVTEIASGKITIGNNTAQAFVRTIVFTNNSFGAGAAAGLTFYHDGSPISKQSGVPVNAGSPEFQFATIEVIPAPGAAALLGLGGLAFARRRRA
ncbi:MAG: hypothetical protein JNK16_16670 [Phycisphaerales bacterium]|nr:hypothetical protein [Phycisphaerales bacterium]